MNLHTDSLWIGKLLRHAIEGIAPVYPCIAAEGAPEEFCTYRRAGYQGRSTKDRYNYQETINLVISICAPTYIRSVELAQKVKDKLDGISGTWDGKMVDLCVMTNAVEEYTGDGYVQSLFFSIDIDTTYGR